MLLGVPTPARLMGFMDVLCLLEARVLMIWRSTELISVETHNPQKYVALIMCRAPWGPFHRTSLTSSQGQANGLRMTSLFTGGVKVREGWIKRMWAGTLWSLSRFLPLGNIRYKTVYSCDWSGFTDKPLSFPENTRLSWLGRNHCPGFSPLSLY